MLFSLVVGCVLHLLPLSVSGLDSPPPGSITVGTGGNHSTLSSALADTSSSVYFIFAGTFNEQVTITRSNIKIYGQTTVPQSFTGNTVTITNNIPASTAGSNDASGTVRVHGTNVSLYNLNIANTFGQGSQAIALSVQEGQFGAYGLKLTGFQDTLLANVGVEYYSNCWIEGAVDFIFGMEASIWITNSIINTVSKGWITASGRSSDDANWYVINNSVVQGTGTTFLGRPWREFARVLFQNTELHSNVQPAGWSPWNATTPTDNVFFAEFNNSGPGITGPRASFATELNSPTSINTVLGSTSWIDPQFL